MIGLTFLGAARTVTGSKYLLDVEGTRILVDCGLFQGIKALRERNWRSLPVDASTLDAVVLTHAHLDHSGFLPRLVANGYRGRIFCTAGTADLCRLVLPDAARIQEEDARDANRRGYSKHHPALPLFTEVDAFRALTQLLPIGYDRPVPVASGVEAEFINAGHLLGSAFVRVRIGDRLIVFGGDLGRYDRPVLPDPQTVPLADALLVESTYGNRRHPPDDSQRVTEIVNRTIDRGGKVIIPSFAIGRVEEVLYRLKALEDAGRIPVVPVYVDSPMAAAALNYYIARRHELDDDMHAQATGGTASRRHDVSAFCTARFKTVETPDESRALVASTAPCIVISSSGMATGGRVLHHLAAVLPDARHTVLFVGYQAPGTRGRSLVEGARTVKMHGRHIPVGAEIVQIDSLSAHADCDEILRWLSGFTEAPEHTFLVHGELPAMTALQAAIQAQLGWPVDIPQDQQRVELWRQGS